jgi:hypothetical protein
MCDEPKKKQMVAPSSDAFVNMYTKYSVSSASPTQLAAIAKVTATLGAGAQLTWWSSQAKQDDLADAFLMCLDGATK